MSLSFAPAVSKSLYVLRNLSTLTTLFGLDPTQRSIYDTYLDKEEIAMQYLVQVVTYHPPSGATDLILSPTMRWGTTWVI